MVVHNTYSVGSCKMGNFRYVGNVLQLGGSCKLFAKCKVLGCVGIGNRLLGLEVWHMKWCYCCANMDGISQYYISDSSREFTVGGETSGIGECAFQDRH